MVLRKTGGSMRQIRKGSTEVDGQKLINDAIRKAGTVEDLSRMIGYGKSTIIAMRNNNTMSRGLQKNLQRFIGEKV